jgi:hypothetical protein
VTLLDSTWLNNIEETDKAKQVVAEERHGRIKSSNDEEHLAELKRQPTELLVCLLVIDCRKIGVFINFQVMEVHGTFQETNPVTTFSFR